MGEMTESTTWGLSLSPSVGTSSVGVGASASYAESKSFTRPDVEVFRHDHDADRDQAAGVTWNLIFTRKDGVNASSFEPRMDLRFQCSKDKLQSGKFRIILAERRLYWGDWAEEIEEVLGQAIGYGTAAGSPYFLPGMVIGSIAGFFVGVAKGNPAISIEEMNRHNDRIHDITHGTSNVMRDLGREVGPENYEVTNTAYELDCDNKMITVVGQ